LVLAKKRGMNGYGKEGVQTGAAWMSSTMIGCTNRSTECLSSKATPKKKLAVKEKDGERIKTMKRSSVHHHHSCEGQHGLGGARQSKKKMGVW